MAVRYEVDYRDYKWISGPDCDPDDYVALVAPRLVKSPHSNRRKKGQRIRKAVVAVEPDSNRLALSIPEAAWLLNCSPNTVWDMVRSGDLPSFMVRRRRLISRAEIDRLISAGRS